MGMHSIDVDALAQRIWQARQEGLIHPAPSVTGTPLDLAMAYQVQQAVTARRLAAGEHVVGWKLGYTSQVMREQMGIDEPNFGPLTDVMALKSGAVAPAFLRQPRVEPEVALVLGKDIPPGTPAGQVIEHVAVARAALEVVDSSWTDYRFDLGDNTADSSSAGAFVLGGDLPLADPAAISVQLEVTGHQPEFGTGDAAMGNPVTALGWLVAQLTTRGETLRSGTVVLTGGMTRAVPLASGATANATFRSGDTVSEVALHCR